MKLPSDGCFELWVRATDNEGMPQPIAAANWKRQRYGADLINRIAVLIG